MQKTLSLLKDKISNALIVDRKNIFIAAIVRFLPIRSYLNLRSNIYLKGTGCSSPMKVKFLSLVIILL